MQRPEDFESGFLQLCAMSYDQVNADTLSIGALPENPFYDSTVYENISIVVNGKDKYTEISQFNDRFLSTCR